MGSTGIHLQPDRVCPVFGPRPGVDPGFSPGIHSWNPTLKMENQNKHRLASKLTQFSDASSQTWMKGNQTRLLTPERERHRKRERVLLEKLLVADFFFVMWSSTGSFGGGFIHFIAQLQPTYHNRWLMAGKGCQIKLGPPLLVDIGT